MKPLAAGGEIDAWCTRCKMDLLHRIIAMHKGRPARVICQTCFSQHNYREPRTPTKGSPSVPRAASPSTSRPSSDGKSTSRGRTEHERRAQWEAKIAGQAVTAFVRYSMDRTFRSGQLVLHPKFGEGYVVDVREDGKVTMMFRDGPRTLAHKP
jgi:hypothetical protein